MKKFLFKFIPAFVCAFMLGFGILHSNDKTEALNTNETEKLELQKITDSIEMIDYDRIINSSSPIGMVFDIGGAFFDAYNEVRYKEIKDGVIEKYKKETEDKRRDYIDEKNKQALYTQQNYVQSESTAYTYSLPSDGLTPRGGVNYYGEQKETYYNLNMNGVVNNAQNAGLAGNYWVREDGVKMYGEYVIVAANQDVHPYGSTVETSLGTGIVLDTGGFAAANPTQVDIATDW